MAERFDPSPWPKILIPLPTSRLTIFTQKSVIHLKSFFYKNSLHPLRKNILRSTNFRERKNPARHKDGESMRNPYTCQSHLTPRVQAGKPSEKSAGDKDKDLNFELKLRSWTTIQICFDCLAAELLFGSQQMLLLPLYPLFFIIQCIYIVFLRFYPTFIMILRKCFKAKRKFMHIAYVNSSMAGKKIYWRKKKFAYLHFNLLRPWLGCSICSLLLDLIVNKNSPSGKFVGQTNWNWNVQHKSVEKSEKKFRYRRL